MRTAFHIHVFDLINKAEQGAIVYPEDINENGRWVIGLAAPIKPPSSESIHGTLFVYLDTLALIDEISEGLNGSVSIVQSFNNVENEFIKVGDGSGDTIERDLVNDIWKLRFNPDSSLSQASIGGIVLQAIPLLLFLIVASIGGLLGIHRFLSTFKADTDHLQNQIADVMNDTHSPSTHFQLAEFQEIDALISRLGKRKAEKPKVKPLNVTAKPAEDPVSVVEQEVESEFSGWLKKTIQHPRLKLLKKRRGGR